MKVRDLVEFSEAPGWYGWLKHQIGGDSSSPMSLGWGAWIVGVCSGATAMQAIQRGELAQVVELIRRKSAVSKCGHIPVDARNLTYPMFLSHETDGRGGEIVYLCQGYDRIRRVRPSENQEEVRFEYGMGIGGIARAVNEGNFNRLAEAANVHPSNPGSE